MSPDTRIGDLPLATTEHDCKLCNGQGFITVIGSDRFSRTSRKCSRCLGTGLNKEARARRAAHQKGIEEGERERWERERKILDGEEDGPDT